MQSSFDALCDGARSIAPYFKSTFPKLNILSARKRLRSAVVGCLGVANGSFDQTERLLLQQLTKDQHLQAAANRVLIGMVLRDNKLAPETALDHLHNMHISADAIRQAMMDYITKHNTPYDEKIALIHGNVGQIKEYIKDATKAVA